MNKVIKIVIFIMTINFIFSSGLLGQSRQLIRVYLNSREDVAELYSYDLDFATRHFKRYADIVVTEDDKKFLEERGFSYEVLDTDIAKTFRETIDVDGDMGDYHTYNEMVDEMTTINQNFPNITKMTSIGQSIEGREIWAMKVSDNPDQEDPNEPDLLYMANMHAREVMTPEVILYFLNYLVTNYGGDPEVTDLVDNREFWLIPTQNPDGHVYVEDFYAGWRKNRRNNGDGTYGVDLNRNYGYMWAYDDIWSSPYTSSDIYRGTGPFSEPESQAIRQLCINHHFVFQLSYHSYGRMWLFPWGYIADNTPHHDIFLYLANRCVAYNQYEAGNAAMGTIYLANGDTDDYMYGEQNEKNMIFGFTPEVGTSFWPPESDIPIVCQENLGPNLYMAKIAPLLEDNPYRIFGPAVPVIDPMDTDEDGIYDVTWSITDDPVNPAVGYELQELSGDTMIVELVDNNVEDRWSLNGFTTSSARSFSPSLSFYSERGDRLNNFLTTAFPLVVEQWMNLTFNTWYYIEDNWDYAYVEVSTDGGQTYNSIPGNITTNNDPYGRNMGNGITGSSNGWIEAVFDLSAFAGQSVFIRFHYNTDEMIEYEGIYVDDIDPVPCFENMTTLFDNISGQSYSISGKEPGIYFYRVRAKDQDDQWSDWSNLEDIEVLGGSPDCQLGDVNNDGDITPEDAWCAFMYFLNGSWPENSDCMNSCADGAADINCTPDGITPGDALYIFLAYLSGEDPPLDCLPPKEFHNRTVSENLELKLVQTKSSTDEISFDLCLNNLKGVQAFGIDIGFPQTMLEFSEVEPSILTECWQMFKGVESLDGVVRLGGFNDEEMANSSGGVLATITFRIKPEAKGTGELWFLSLTDDFEEASTQSCVFHLLPTDVRQISQQEIPGTYRLEQNYPNPFNMETEIVYQIPEDAVVDLAVYNSRGQKIRSLVAQRQSAGRYAVKWDGRNGIGNEMSSGIFFISLKANHFKVTRKLVLVK